jgi:predicted anti-sigma-YlaC factor YlaD
MSKHVREDLGAYVLGALEPAERHTVEAHLDACGSCRDELSRLSGLPGLLDRLSAEEAQLDVGDVRAAAARDLSRSVAGEYVRLRRAVTRWRLAAAAATFAALLVGLWSWSPWQPPPDRIVAAVVPVAEDAASTEGTVAAYAWEWGITVEIRVAELPARPQYVMWAVSRDGERQRAGTWGPTAHRGAVVRGASALPRDQLLRVEVTDELGQQLLGASFNGPS